MKTIQTFSLIILTFLLIITSCFQVNAQTWEKTIKAAGKDDIFYFAINDQDDIALFISNVDFSVKPVVNRIRVVILDKNGTTKRQKTLQPQDFDSSLDSTIGDLHMGSVIFDQGRYLVAAGLKIDTPNTHAEVFFELDTNLNLLQYKFHDTTTTGRKAYGRFKKIKNQNFAVGVFFETDWKVIFTEVTDSLNKKNPVLLFNTPDSLKMWLASDFLMDQAKNLYFFVDEKNVADLEIIKLDSNFRLIKKVPITHPVLPHDVYVIVSGRMNAFWSKDSTIIMTLLGPTDNGKGDLHFYEFNTDFQQLNYKRIVTIDTSEFNFNPPTAVFDSLCNCFYQGVTKRFDGWNAPILGGGDTTDFQLVRFDEDLNIKFNRYYRRNKFFIFMALDTDSEGNVIMVGQTQEINPVDPTNSEIFVLKVDSLGNLNAPVGLQESETEINRLNFRFFPNPTKGLVNFRQYNVMEDYRMDLYDSQGRILQQYRLQNSDNSIDLSDYPKGVYLYRLTDSKGRRTSGKLVRE